MKTAAVSIALALLCAFGAYHFAIQKSFVNPYPIVCEFVAQKIYLDDKRIADWKKTCLQRSRLVTVSSPRKLILQDLNNVFGLLNVSHLEIFDSSEVQNIWKGESTETGIEGDFVDSEFVVFMIHPNSPAEKAGIRKGDLIKALNGEQPSSWTVASTTGKYDLVRGGKTFSVEISSGSFTRDDSPVVESQAAGKVLKVPSFRSDFFEDNNMKAMAAKIHDSRQVILDLRGNAGGNFVAGLRLLSMFVCTPTEVGSLIHPKVADGALALPNDLRDEQQLQVLGSNHRTVLKTFRQDDCYKGPVKVLIDGRSSSVAEMVAQALKEIRHVPIAGAPSRGQLLVGVWYPMDEVGAGVQISIPEAYYESVRGYQIEGNGVQVDKTLYYRLPQMQTGVDSWVDEMLRN